MPLPSQIIRLLNPFTSNNNSSLLQQLQSLTISEQESNSINQELQQKIIESFKNLLTNGQIDDICSLLNAVWKSLVNKSIKKNVLILLLDGVLECIGIEDLKGVLGVISDRVEEMREFMADISHHLLRIVNTLLKRISKTTDYQVRGQLHLTITKIINFCHQSGFQYRHGSSQFNKKMQLQQGILQGLNESNLSLQFFHEFWQIQKYFMDLQQLYKDETRDGESTSKQDLSLIPIRIRKIEITLTNILNYFKINTPTENKISSSFPIKFLKLPNLLSLQLQDSYFRILILVQTIVFCSSFQILPTKYKIKLNEESMNAINRIKNKVNQYLNIVLNVRSDFDGLQSLVQAFLKNQAFWIELKDNWRQKKKTFFKTGNEDQPAVADLKKSQSNAQNMQTQPAAAQPAVTPQKKVLSISEVSKKAQKQIKSRMQIKPSLINRFLDHTQAPILKKQPISTSFAYYYNQAKHCLQTFDSTQQCQTEFETRPQYNLFEWKAFRSLSRQRIVTGIQSQKVGNLYADYKLLDFVNRKEELFQGQPRKRVKLDLHPNQN